MYVTGHQIIQQVSAHKKMMQRGTPTQCFQTDVGFPIHRMFEQVQVWSRGAVQCCAVQFGSVVRLRYFSLGIHVFSHKTAAP